MNSAHNPARGQRTKFPFLGATLMLLPLIMAINIFAQEEPLRVDVTTADRVAATYGQSNLAYHVYPLKTQAGKAALAAGNLGTSGAQVSARSLAATIPAVPAPGFYGEDLVYFGGKVLPAGFKATTSHNVYVNMSSCGGTVAECWGNPQKFLADLNQSNMIHLTDQYVFTSANNRYPAGAPVSTTIPLFAGDNVVGQNDLLAVVHAAAKIFGAGYDHIYHVFLPKGVDTCFDLTSVCYSPDNPPSFVFCAYHGSVDFSDIGHVVLSVEPYQNVLGCAEPAPNPNGALVDSTNSTLSHEQIESITDPDPFGAFNPKSGWVAVNSLVAFQNEIGDLCVILTSDPAVLLNGQKYQLQGEYSNRYHACAFAP